MSIIDRLLGAANGTHGLDEAEEAALLRDAADEIEQLRGGLVSSEKIAVILADAGVENTAYYAIKIAEGIESGELMQQRSRHGRDQPAMMPCWFDKEEPMPRQSTRISGNG